MKINIAHNEGNYFTDTKHLDKLKNENLIAFRYCDEIGNIDDKSNPNGSLESIAGIFNDNKNILGMMPHPERMVDEKKQSEAEKKIDEMCKKLLVNLIIEDYTITKIS